MHKLMAAKLMLRRCVLQGLGVPSYREINFQFPAPLWNVPYFLPHLVLYQNETLPLKFSFNSHFLCGVFLHPTE